MRYREDKMPSSPRLGTVGKVMGMVKYFVGQIGKFLKEVNGNDHFSKFKGLVNVQTGDVFG